MRPARRGQRWGADEEDMLLGELRGETALSEIAARHLRSMGAICGRIEKLFAPEGEFATNEELFEWARLELRKGHAGCHGELVERADGAAVAEYPILECSAEHTPRSAGAVNGGRPVRVHPVGAGRRKAAEIWAVLSSHSPGEPGVRSEPGAAELKVLGGFDVARLERAAAVLRSRRAISLAGWVLECDWPGIEDLSVTAEEISMGDDAVCWKGSELLLAGLGRSYDRDREIMRMRLGLLGEAMTLDAISEIVCLTKERIRQIQKAVIKRARVTQTADVQRGWHQASGVLVAALSSHEQPGLDVDLLLSFVELAVPLAPRDVAVRLVAAMCGLSSDDEFQLVEAVDVRHAERVVVREQILRHKNAQAKIARTLVKLVERAEWPECRSALADGAASPLRSPVHESGRSRSGLWMSERLGRKVGYDSGAELEVIQLLDVSPEVLTYCEQPISVSYELLGRRHTYYPDLLADFHDGSRLLIEVKARMDEFAWQENVVKFAAARELCRNLRWGFIATTPRIQTSADLASREVDPRVEDVLEDLLAMGAVDWNIVYPVALRYGIRYTDIATLTLRNGWYWHRNPFRLSATPFDEQSRWGSLA